MLVECVVCCDVMVVLFAHILMHRMNRTFGQFFAGIVDGVFIEILPDTGWRYMLGLAAVPGLFMFFGFLHLPESPRWLAAKGRVEEAEAILRTLRDSDAEATDELADIVQTMESPAAATGESEPAETRTGLGGSNGLQDLAEDDDAFLDEGETALEYGTTPRIVSPPCSDNSSLWQRFWEMVSDAPTRKALVLGCGLMVVQQCSGINTVMYYAGSIYEKNEFDEVTSVWLSAFTALAQVAGVGISIFLVDRYVALCNIVSR